MKVVQVLTFCVFVSSTLAFVVVSEEAEKCIPSKCKLEDGCICSSTSSPLPIEKTPQFVTITIDDSVTADYHTRYYSDLLYDRKNGDGSPISATFYVPHLYTDYEAVNKLFNKGFEIGVNSITKGTADYFSKASLEVLIDEFDGQRKIISKFANIPIEYITGVRTPHFQISGNKTFEAYDAAGLEYDNSWVALSNHNLYPYSLHYKSGQPAVIGNAPESSFPNQCVIPINNFLAKSGGDCNVLFSCGLNGTSTEISEWLINKYKGIKSSSKAPINFLINAAWFEREPSSFVGFKELISYIQTQNDTFVVSHSQLLSWAKNPEPLGVYRPQIDHPEQFCLGLTCPLPFGEEIRYMKSCVPCPNVYPWLKNPEGN